MSSFLKARPELSYLLLRLLSTHFGAIKPNSCPKNGVSLDGQCCEDCFGHTMALPLRTPRETPHHGRLARARSASEKQTGRAGGDPSKNRLAQFFGQVRRVDCCPHRVNTGHRLNASIRPHCRACQTSPTDWAGMSPLGPRLANRRRNGCLPVAKAEWLWGHVDNQPYDGWHRKGWPRG